MQGNINIPDSTITTNLSFRQLVLMNMQQLTNFPYIEKDFDALTDYELLCLVVKFLNDVIANQNEQNDSITRMYESFLALQDYVNNTKDELEDAFNNLDDYVRNYFDNLDVQEEINNKLDQMLEDGVLEQIIEQFLQLTSLICFDNVADMKSSVNLTNGSFAKTLGYYNKNDGGGATYKIRTITNQDIIDEMFILKLDGNTLIAELIPENKIVNSKQVGLKGDNSTDETTKLQNLFSSSYNIKMNTGTYITNESLTINSNKEVIGEENVIIKAKQGMAIDIPVILITSDDIKLDNIIVSGNIQQNPIGDVYNSVHGISLIDFVDSCKNVLVQNCKLIDNAYAAIRMRCTSTGATFENFTFKNNYFNNIDCGIISLSSSQKLMSLKNIYYLNNTFDGYNKSEPISIFHYGTAKNIVIDGNIICNKQLGHGIAIERNTVSQLIISNNNIYDCSGGIDVQNATNVNIENNIITGINNYINEAIILSNCNNVICNNNLLDKIANEGITTDTCTYTNVENNMIKNININSAESYKLGIKIKDCSYSNFANNYCTKHSTNYSNAYGLYGTCDYLSINETNNNSITTYGIDMSNLTTLTNSKILTNLSIRNNFNATKVNSNTNKIVQNDNSVVTTVGYLPGNYRFTRKIRYNISTNQTWSTIQIYNPIDYEVYEFFINATGVITLTSDSSSDFGIIWKEDRTIPANTKTSVKLMYINNKLYEI